MEKNIEKQHIELSTASRWEKAGVPGCYAIYVQEYLCDWTIS